jgi:hypothetical protein
MTTILVPDRQLAELRVKLTNLVDDVEDRLYNNDNADSQQLFDLMLDRLTELATGLIPAPSTHDIPTSAEPMCAVCHRLRATARVSAGTPGTDQHFSEAVCTHCTLPAITRASLTGPVAVHPIKPTPEEVDG